MSRNKNTKIKKCISPTKKERKALDDSFSYNPGSGILFRKHSRYGYWMKVTTAINPGNRYPRVRIIDSKKPETRAFLYHRICYYLMNGQMPPNGIFCDHINGNRTDNRWENLRWVPQPENAKNTKRFRLTGIMAGIKPMIEKQRWSVSIQHNKRKYHLGTYKTQRDAEVICEIANTFIRRNDVISFKMLVDETKKFSQIGRPPKNKQGQC